VGHGLEADFNRKKTSNYTDQIGKPVPPRCARWSTTAPWAARAARSTSTTRGHPGRRNVLIENGKLVGYMQDHISARHFGSTPAATGAAESFRHEPLPRMTNTLLMAGQDAPEDIIRSVKRGVYAKNFSGGQVNISNGDFVFSLTESYLIEDGKADGAAQGVNLDREWARGAAQRDDGWAVTSSCPTAPGTCGKDGSRCRWASATPTVKIRPDHRGRDAGRDEPRRGSGPHARPAAIASAWPSRCCRLTLTAGADGARCLVRDGSS
jgi:TldD protein